MRGDHDFIFYNQLKSQDGSSWSATGDNRSGQGDGDDESLVVDLSKVSPEVEAGAITVAFIDAQSRGRILDKLPMLLSVSSIGIQV